MRARVHLIFYPGHEKIDYFFLLSFGKRFAFFDLVPLFETSPAATCAGVLSLKDRMPLHRGLVSVVFGKGRCKSCPDKILCVVSYGLMPFCLTYFRSASSREKDERNFDLLRRSRASFTVCIISPAFNRVDKRLIKV